MEQRESTGMLCACVCVEGVGGTACDWKSRCFLYVCVGGQVVGWLAGALMSCLFMYLYMHVDRYARCYL